MTFVKFIEHFCSLLICSLLKRREDAVKFIATARQLGKLTDADMTEAEKRARDTTSTKPSDSVLDAVVREVQGYVYLETDPERIKQAIY